MRFEAMRNIRKAREVPMAEVAQATGKSLAWVYQVERGLTVPTRDDAEKIAQLLDQPVEELFSRIRESESRELVVSDHVPRA